jgi:hypothetical protein
MAAVMSEGSVAENVLISLKSGEDLNRVGNIK